MAEETQDRKEEQGRSGEGGGASTAMKAAAAVAATGVAALGAKRALSSRTGSNGHSRNGASGSGKGDVSSMLNSALAGGWDAARDALMPAAEDAAGTAGEYLAKNGPDFVRERLVPRFIESFNEASGAR
jgi:hypothetical protein